MSKADEKPTPLGDALAALQREFPDALLTEVRIEFRTGERHDARPSETWCTTDWGVQVGNDHGRGDSFEKAMIKLREEVRAKTLIPGYVERVAAVLRELPEGYHDRCTIVMQAQELVLMEERGR